MGEVLGLGVVVLAAAAVAAIVYRLAVRRGPGVAWSEGGWSGGAQVSGPQSPTGSETSWSGGPFVPATERSTSPRDRITGVVGLLLMVTLGALLLALGLYAGGSMLAHLISKAAHSGG